MPPDGVQGERNRLVLLVPGLWTIVVMSARVWVRGRRLDGKGKSIYEKVAVSEHDIVTGFEFACHGKSPRRHSSIVVPKLGQIATIGRLGRPHTLEMRLRHAGFGVPPHSVVGHKQHIVWDGQVKLSLYRHLRLRDVVNDRQCHRWRRRKRKRGRRGWFELYQSGLLRKANKIIFRHKVVELLQRQVVVRSIEVEHVEDLLFAVVQVNGSRVRPSRNHLENEHSERHLDPAPGDGLSYLQELANNSIGEMFGVIA